MTATVTSDFREEFEAERSRWLRRRFLWYTGIFGALGLLATLASVAIFFNISREAFGLAIGVVGLNLVGATLYVAFFLHVRRADRPITRAALVRLVFWLIVLNGILQLPAAPMGNRIAELTFQTMALPDEHRAVPGQEAGGRSLEAEGPVAGGERRGEFRKVRLGFQWLLSVLFAHFLAALFIPWSPREAIKPLAPLLILFALLLLLFGEGSLVWRVALIAGSPLIGAPGVLWCSWRTNRFRNRFLSRVLRRSYRQMKRELVDARRIHEDLFPPPLTTGAIRFVYRYEPMKQIGGDFLYAHRFPGVDDDAAEPVSVVIIDVTGHGVPAALTVNRLFGELERLFGEDPDIPPGDVLSALNSYVHYTLASHSVYATAICMRVDSNLDVLEWASGGHPPAFVRSADGRIDRLDSTALLLGVCVGADFEPMQRSMPFFAGDTIIAYTDGAIEARNENGRMLGLEGFQRLVASLRPDPGQENGWASSLLRAVERRRFGPPADDTLIVEIYRPLSV